MIRIVFLILSFLSVSVVLGGQTRDDSVKPRGFSKMSVIYLDVNGKSYPKSHLARVSQDSLLLVNRTVNNYTLEPQYFQGKVSLGDIDNLTLISKPRKLKFNLLGAAIGGLTGYFVGRALRPEQLEQNNIQLTGQAPKNGFMEPILGVIIGGSIGVIIGDRLAPVTINQVRENQRQASRQLRDLSPGKKRK